MVKDYQQLWKRVVREIDKAQAIRTLSGVLVEKEGRVYISRLHREDAELCVGILDNVSHYLHSPRSPLP